MRLPIRATTKIITLPMRRVQSLRRITSLIPPAIQSLVRWAMIPTTSPAAREAIIGALMLPGPFSLNARRVGNAMRMIRKTTFTAGRATPSRVFSLYALPREKPRERKKQPIAIPPTKPKRATRALRSPPASLSTILNGHPRKVRAPIITKKPSIKRVKGLEPPRGLNSPFTREMIKEPSTIPMTSGLMYWTTAAL